MISQWSLRVVPPGKLRLYFGSQCDKQKIHFVLEFSAFERKKFFATRRNQSLRKREKEKKRLRKKISSSDDELEKGSSAG